MIKVIRSKEIQYPRKEMVVVTFYVTSPITVVCFALSALQDTDRIIR